MKMDPSISARTSRPPTSEEHDEEPRSTSDEDHVGMSLLEDLRQMLNVEYNLFAYSELFLLGTFEGKSSDSLHLRSFVNRWKLYTSLC
jgi:hypothetical protein